MCGIIGYTGTRDAKTVVLSGLRELEYRGYDSAGIAYEQNGEIVIKKSVGRVEKLADLLDNEKMASSCGIGHTRWATHGEATEINCHPHVCRDVTLVHNGIIENYREIAGMLDSEGLRPHSETDTEIAALLLGSRYHGDPLRTLRDCLPLLEGSYAFAILFADHPSEIYAARMGSPLVVTHTDKGSVLSSDILGTIAFSKAYFAMPERTIARLTVEGVDLFNYRGKKLNPKWEEVHWDIEGARKQGYEYYMQKEIHEEPKALTDTIQARLADGQIDFTLDGIPDALFNESDEIVISACGTAMHAGLVGKTLIERLLRLPVRVEIASEFRYSDPLLSEHTLFVAISQSGETADTLAALRLAKQNAVRTLAIVNVKGSSIARESDYVLYTHAGPEVAVASTKAYSVQLAALYLLTLRIGCVRGTLTPELFAGLTKELCRMPKLVETLLKQEQSVKQSSLRLTECQDLFFIGRGLDYALSMEGSIKLKEISYIHSEAYAAGELKHGTISLIVDGVPCIALATQPELQAKMVSNIREVRSRGAFVILITDHAFPDAPELYDVRLEIPDCDPRFTPFLAVVYLQLIAYYVSYGKGLDVDHPRNLAKSVTVE